MSVNFARTYFLENQVDGKSTGLDLEANQPIIN